MKRDVSLAFHISHLTYHLSLSTFLSLGLCSLAHAAVPLSVIAVSGQQAPDTPGGAVFRSFAKLLINGQNGVAFHASLATGAVYEGIWSNIDTSPIVLTPGLRLVAGAGDQAPDTPNGAKFYFFSTVLTDKTGQTAFLANLLPGAGGVNATNREGLWCERANVRRLGFTTPVLIMRQGDQAPGTPLGTLFHTPPSHFSIDDLGRLAFVGNLQQGTGT